MIRNVSMLSDVWQQKMGSVSGSCPMSPTVRTSHPKSIVRAVSTIMVMSGRGPPGHAWKR